MRSLSLKAYKALSGKASIDRDVERPGRLDGTLIWVATDSEQHMRAAVYLGERIRQIRGRTNLLITGSESHRLPEKSWVQFDILPADTTKICQDFLDHWTPDIGIWIGGSLRPILLDSARRAGIPLILQRAQVSQLNSKPMTWLPRLSHDVLDVFDVITADSTDTAHLIRKHIGLDRRIPVSAPLQIASSALPVHQSRLDEAREMVAGRPVWIAAHLHSSEVADILAAHRASLRLTHRLLLVVTCANEEDGTRTRSLLANSSWRVCFWDDGELIDETTQIVVVEDQTDLGLWYRLAPVCFIGCSLRTGLGGQDPYHACALGSAVIYGPNVSSHLSSYSRLAKEGGARIVRDADGLVRALTHLLAADQAAAMAHAAWKTISEGAEATDELATQIIDLLDARDALKASGDKT